MSVSQKDGGTRSGLLWEVERILDELENKPQILLMENVPEVVGTKNIKDFKKWESKLRSLGYSNYVEILNAKDFGIPQNRRRCFMISILGDYAYNFPCKLRLKHRIWDLIEKTNVDEKYYLTDAFIKYMLNEDTKKYRRKEAAINQLKLVNIKGIAGTITTRAGSRAIDNFIIVDRDVMIGTYQYGYSDEFIKGKNRFAKGKDIIDTILTSPKEGIVLKTAGKQNPIIRKLTPCDCLKLMGFTEKDCQSLREIGLSDAAIIHCAGDSIVTTVLMAIFSQLFEIDHTKVIQDYVDKEIIYEN